MVVPHHHQAVAKQLALRSWVDGKNFKRDVHFGTVDGAKALLGTHSNTDKPRDECIVQVLAAALDEEGALLAYIIEKGTYDLSHDDSGQEWARACNACGWVVLQAYELSVRKNEWPKDGGSDNG